jgi:hypothetical protein
MQQIHYLNHDWVNLGGTRRWGGVIILRERGVGCLTHLHTPPTPGPLTGQVRPSGNPVKSAGWPTGRIS